MKARIVRPSGFDSGPILGSRSGLARPASRVPCGARCRTGGSERRGCTRGVVARTPASSAIALPGTDGESKNRRSEEATRRTAGPTLDAWNPRAGGTPAVGSHWPARSRQPLSVIFRPSILRIFGSSTWPSARPARLRLPPAR